MTAVLTAGPLSSARAIETASLRVHESGRYLIEENGKPFFWLADTAWELFHRLTREEAAFYLEDRASKGFTAVLAVVLAERDGLRVPNPYGDLPLVDKDPTRPNEAYFAHVDYIVHKANSLGITIGMLPTWGDKVNIAWGEGPEIFTPSNARPYGEYLGKRYRDSGIVWVIGGDRSLEEGHEAIWEAMALGLRAGDHQRHLITGHFPGGSDHFFHDKEWLDFNFAYSGHRWAAPNYRNISWAFERKPVKPVIDGEPRYENHPYHSDGTPFYPERERWDRITRGNAAQMRQAAYWAVLAGAAGHSYGCHDIWQMYDEQREKVTFANTPWKQALDFPGSTQMGILRRLFESYDWTQLRPDLSLVLEGQLPGEGHVQSAVARDGSFLMAYVPQGQVVIIKTDSLKGNTFRASWFDPRTAQRTKIGEFANTGSQRFEPLHKDRPSDFVLVLEQAEGS